MKAANRVLPLVTMLLFSWFQGFQLCDEADDAAQALSTYASVGVTPQRLHWSPASAAYEDADASFPLVVGQTLRHSGTGLQLGTNHSRIVPTIRLTTGMTMNPVSVGRSPPSYFLSQIVPSLNSLIFARNPAHCLAPPFSNPFLPR